MNFKMTILIIFITSCVAETQKSDKTLDPNKIKKGKILVSAYGCMNCHRIPGLQGYPTTIGPSLEGWKKRKTIAGKLPNTRENLIKWLHNTHSIEPETNMPDLNVSKKQAKAMSEYLFSL